MVLDANDAFEVVWRDPSDGRLYWGMDRIHFQRPYPPLGREFLEAIMTIAFGRRTIFVNGYAYMHNYGPPDPPDFVYERGPFTIWAEDFLPRVREACRAMRAPNYDALPPEKLADSVDDVIRRTAETFRYTTIVILAFLEPVMDLLEFCEAELGAEGPTTVASLLQGVENETALAGEGLAHLTRLAEGLPAVAAELRGGRFEGLESLPGGEQFARELKLYLDVYGWRAESWCLLHVPTWAEEPRRALEHVARYLQSPDRLPTLARQRALEQREKAAGELESRLPPEKQARFRELLAAAMGHVPMSEERAFWQLTILGSARVPLLALGRKLVAAGVLSSANDVFFLSSDELKRASRNPGASLDSLVTERKAELARQERLRAPAYIGQRLDIETLSPLMKRFVRHFRGAGGGAAGDSTTIRGSGASKGKVRARARVIHDLGEAHRLQPGEVLVCSTTSPPWTPLFAIAGGVVTDTGGILSHSAICAREYAIPCVVGTQVATRFIPDGALVSIDGTAGVVVIEEVD